MRCIRWHSARTEPHRVSGDGGGVERGDRGCVATLEHDDVFSDAVTGECVATLVGHDRGVRCDAGGSFRLAFGGIP